MNENDKISCLRFDMDKYLDNKKSPSEFNK